MPPPSDPEGVRFLQWCLPRLGLRWRGFRRVRRQVYRRLERRVAELGLTGLDDYRSYLEGHASEWSMLDTLCLIPISRFYRDRAAFQHLQLTVLPELSRMVLAADEDELRCWSLGCASGEEPYTVAIIWKLGVSPRFPGLRLRMLGTDIDRDAIERAERGCYAPYSLKELPPAMRAQAFERSPAGLVLNANYREGVEFRVQDVRTTMPDGPFHLILCRNVVFTYFETELQRRTLRRLIPRLAPGGVLMIGASESLPVGAEGLEPWPGERKVYRSHGGVPAQDETAVGGRLHAAAERRGDLAEPRA
jgi:chemotaxis protein methyltransferase CheR